MRRQLFVFLSIVLLVSACGGDSDDADDPSTSAGQDGTTTTMAGMNDMDDSEDMGAMNMGDPMATPAEEVAGADLSTATFVLLETRPRAMTKRRARLLLLGTRRAPPSPSDSRVSSPASSTSPICMMGCARTTVVTKFEADGSDIPPNEIHLAFTAAADGSGFMTAENDRPVGPDARSIIVHPLELLDNKLVCAEF